MISNEQIEAAFVDALITCVLAEGDAEEISRSYDENGVCTVLAKRYISLVNIKVDFTFTVPIDE